MSKLNINDCYFYSIIGDANYSLETLEAIIQSGHVLSRAKLQQKDSNKLNKDDEICLIKPASSKERRAYGRETSGFYHYTTKFLSLVLDNKVGPIEKVTYKPIFSDYDLKQLGSFATFYDEVRTKDAISLDHLIGVSVPYSKYVDEGDISFLGFCDEEIVDYYTKRRMVNPNHPLHQDMVSYDINYPQVREAYLLNYLKVIRSILVKYQIDVPIYLHQKEAGKDTFKVYQK